MRIPAALLVLLALATPGHADHCAAPTTSDPDVDAAGFYVEIDIPCGIDSACAWYAWVYQESNGLDGLQRYDDNSDDTCHGMIAPDTMISETFIPH